MWVCVCVYSFRTLTLLPPSVHMFFCSVILGVLLFFLSHFSFFFIYNCHIFFPNSGVYNWDPSIVRCSVFLLFAHCCYRRYTIQYVFFPPWLTTQNVIDLFPPNTTDGEFLTLLLCLGLNCLFCVEMMYIFLI